MNQSRAFDQILQMRARQEITQVDELAMTFIFDVDDTTTGLATADLLAVDEDVFVRPNDREWDHRSDSLVQLDLRRIVLLVVEREKTNLMMSKLGLDALLERFTFLKCHAVGLGDDRHDIDDLGQLAKDGDVERLERVTRGVDEEETAVDASVRDESVALSGELFAEVGRVLVFDLHQECLFSYDCFCKPCLWGRTYRTIGSQHPSLLIMSP